MHHDHFPHSAMFAKRQTLPTSAYRQSPECAHLQFTERRRTVVILNGDGSLGLNLMELDTAVGQGLPVLVLVSNNAGCTARPKGDFRRPGRELGIERYDVIAESFGAHGEFVEKPRAIRPALERGMKEVEKGRPAFINVVTEPTAMARTIEFVKYGE